MAAQPRPAFVFFDANYTLFRPVPSVGLHYAELASDFGVAASPRALEAAFPAAWRWARTTMPMHPEVPYGRTRPDSLQFWSAVVRRCFAEAGAPDPPEPYYEEIFDRFGQSGTWVPYDDVAPALAMLAREGIRWGVLSNFDLRLHRVLAGHDWARDAAVVLTSSEAGAEKPHPAIFAAAARATGLPPGAPIALIGDDPRSDGGAVRAGWQVCLVPRREWITDEVEVNGATIPKFTTAVEAVEHLLCADG